MKTSLCLYSWYRKSKREDHLWVFTSAGAAVNIYSFFPPPPEAGDGENKVRLCRVCTISTSKTKQRFV